MYCPHCQHAAPDGSQFCNHCGKSTQLKSRPSTTFRLGRIVGFVLIPSLMTGFILWFVVRGVYGSRQTNQAIAAAVKAPITLKDEVQNLPAASWKAATLNLPYDGNVDVDLKIVQGNPIDVFLTTPDQLDAMKRRAWGEVKVFADFNAVKTKTYRRTGRLNQGSYYLVMRDTSLGILSSSATDIAVKVSLNP